MADKLPFKLSDPSLFHDRALIGGDWRESVSGKRFDIIDPGSDKVFASAPVCGADDVDATVQAAQRAFETYRKVNPRERAQCLYKWHNLINENRDDIAQIVTHETGKPLAESQGEITYALGFPWWFAGEAERVHGEVSQPAQPGRRLLTIKQPIGVAVALVPWNFPIAMIMRKAAAALAAGCTMIIKPSPETPLSVLTLAELAHRAGFAPGVLSVLTTDLAQTPAISEALCKHELVRKVTFTGSTRVGKLVARHCSDGLKKVTLELGGNCPFIVFDDANLDQALEALTLLKWRHAGQACISANRVYVQAGVYDKFASMVVEKAKSLKLGHGAKEGTTMGPVTTPAGIEKVEKQIADAVKLGGTIATGGKRPAGTELGKGYFFEPTVMTGMKHDMLARREETFGPLLSLYSFQTEDEAVQVANDTSMGLASYFFTKDVDRTWRLWENLEAGMVGANTGNMSSAESPFGGIKESGYGKESGRDVAVDEYCITKTCQLTLEGHY